MGKSGRRHRTKTLSRRDNKKQIRDKEGTDLARGLYAATTGDSHRCADKRRFATKREARIAAQGAADTYGKPIGCYRCRICGGYHLTHIIHSKLNFSVEPRRKRNCGTRSAMYTTGRRRTTDDHRPMRYQVAQWMWCRGRSVEDIGDRLGASPANVREWLVEDMLGREERKEDGWDTGGSELL